MCADRWTDFVPKVAEQREVCFASGGGDRWSKKDSRGFYM